MRIVVTGGTGTLGREVVRALRDQPATVRVLSRGPASDKLGEVEWAQVDYTTGAGLEEALSGADVIVHAAHDGPRQMRGDVSGLEWLLAAAKRAGAGHFVYVSIVGAAKVPGFAYYAGKARAEELVRSSPLSTSVFRATQFFGLIDGLLGGLNRLPWLLLPRGLVFQPVDVREVGAALARHALSPAQSEVEFAGPQVRTLPDLAAAWLAVRGQHKAVREVSLSLPPVRAVASGKLTSSTAERGQTTWEMWLRQERRS